MSACRYGAASIRAAFSLSLLVSVLVQPVAGGTAAASDGQQPAVPSSTALTDAAPGRAQATTPLGSPGGSAASFTVVSTSTRAWGWNRFGQVGDGTTTNRTSPVAVVGMSEAIGLGAGDSHSLAVKADGAAWSWGDNSQGQLGDGTTTQRNTPVQVSGLTNVVAVATGHQHSLALKADRTVWAWGNNASGQLGDNTTANRTTPVQVKGPGGNGFLGDVVAIEGGVFFSLALKSDGTVWAWGDGSRGRLGNGGTTNQTTPVQVSNLSGVVAITAGWNFALALKADGTVWGWGDNSESQLSDGTTIDRLAPVRVGALTNVIAFAAGGNHVVATKTDGTVWAWGNNRNGQIGDGTQINRPTPVQLSGISNVSALAAGWEHSLAVKADGRTAWAWGDNSQGQLGDGTTTRRTAPVQVSIISGTGGVVAGKQHSLANDCLWIEAVPLGTEHNPPYINGATAMAGVHTLTGSFGSTHTDVAISGRGPTPFLSRTVNSNDTRIGPLGIGWQHSYAGRLVTPSTGTGVIVLVGPQGRSDRYIPNADGTYTPPAGVDTALKKNADGTYTAAGKDQTTWNFDSCGRLSTIKDRHGNTSTLTYNTVGQLSSVSDPAGRGSLTFNYDSTTKRLTSVTDWQAPTARTVSYAYDTSGRLQTATDRNGKQTTYAYDGTTSHLTTITDANSHVPVTNHYNGSGQVDWQKDASGNQTNFSYVTNGDGTATTTVTYPTTSYDTGWNYKVTDHYDARGTSAVSGKDWLLSSASQPTSTQTDTTTYTYTSAGFPSSVQDPRGNTTTLCWDADYMGSVITGSLGNLTRVIGPAVTDARTGNSVRPVTLSKYDSHRNLLEQVRPDGVPSSSGTGCADNVSAINSQYVTAFTYDANGVKLLSTAATFTDPELGSQTATTQYQYGDANNPGRVTGIVSPRNNTTSLAYFQPGNTQAGLLQSVTDPLTAKTTYTYNAVGRRLTMVDAVGNGGAPGDHTWTWAYDNEDRLTSMQAPQPSGSPGKLTSSFQYDAVGNRTQQTDPKTQITYFKYDLRNLLQEVDESATASDPNNDANKIVTTYAYDNLSNLTRLIRAQGSGSERATDYQYDGKNRQRKETQYTSWPSTGSQLTTSFTYDGDNNSITQVDPLNQTTTLGYDVLNRLTSKTYTNPAPGTATTPNVSYAYDLDSVRKSMADGTGTTCYTADSLDRLTSVSTAGAGCGSQTQAAGYRYDLDGNRRKLVYPDGTSVQYTFDAADRMQSLQDWANRTTSFAYDRDNRLHLVTNFNGTTATYGYDEARRSNSVDTECAAPECSANVGKVSKYVYTLDAIGNHTAVDEDLLVPPPPSCQTNCVPTLTSNYYAYTFDNLYRLTYANAYYGTTNYSYDPAGNRQSRVRTISGTPTTITYSYNTADQINTVTTNGTPAAYPSNANGNLTGRGTDSLTYDQADRLTQAVVDGITSNDTYNGDGNRVGHTGEQFGSATYINDVNQSLPVMLDDGTLKYVWGPNGLVYDVTHDGTVIEVHHQDGLSTTRVLTDASGNPLDSYVVDEGGIPTSTTGTSTQPVRFTGEPRDEVAGLSYLRSRYYDPFLGRFLSRDSLAGTVTRPASLNRFAYASDNPVTETDPSGHDDWWRPDAGGFDTGLTDVPNSSGSTDNNCFSSGNGFLAGNAINVVGCGNMPMLSEIAVQVQTPSGPVSVSGIAASMSPSGGGSGSNDKPTEIFQGKKLSPNWPGDFVRAAGNALRKVNIKDRDLLSKLRDIEKGDWKKVYEDGYSENRRVSVHYFQSPSGQVFDLQVHPGWSNLP
jgi:RHS repeat-associated protein